jgi:hypothetical protein
MSQGLPAVPMIRRHRVLCLPPLCTLHTSLHQPPLHLHFQRKVQSGTLAMLQGQGGAPFVEWKMLTQTVTKSDEHDNRKMDSPRMNFENCMSNKIIWKKAEGIGLGETGGCGSPLPMVPSLTVGWGEAFIVKVRQLYKTSNIVGRKCIAVKL